MMVDYLASKLRESGVDVVAADLMQADEGELAMELVDAAGIVFGTSMVLTGPHPKSVYAAYLANILRPKGKFYAVVGSFGWGGNLCAPIDNMFTPFKPKKLTSVIAKGRPAAAGFCRAGFFVRGDFGRAIILKEAQTFPRTKSFFCAFFAVYKNRRK